MHMAFHISGSSKPAPVACGHAAHHPGLAVAGMLTTAGHAPKWTGAGPKASRNKAQSWHWLPKGTWRCSTSLGVAAIIDETIARLPKCKGLARGSSSCEAVDDALPARLAPLAALPTPAHALVGSFRHGVNSIEA